MKLLNLIRYKINQIDSYVKMDKKKRSIEEVFKMKVLIEKEYLLRDRQERDTSIAKEKLDLINWILGEEL